MNKIVKIIFLLLYLLIEFYFVFSDSAFDEFAFFRIIGVAIFTFFNISTNYSLYIFIGFMPFEGEISAFDDFSIHKLIGILLAINWLFDSRTKSFDKLVYYFIHKKWIYFILIATILSLKGIDISVLPGALFTIIQNLLLAIIVADIIRENKDIDDLLFLSFCSLILSAVFIVGFDTLLFGSERLEISSSNDLGIFSAFFLVLSLYRMLGTKDKMIKIFYIISSATFLFATASRSAILAALLSCFLIGFFPKKISLKMIFPIIIAIVIIIAGFNYAGKKSQDSGRYKHMGVDIERVIERDFRVVNNIILASNFITNPFKMNGLGNKINDITARDPHGDLPLLLGELGIFGVLFYFYVFYCLIRIALNTPAIYRPLAFSFIPLLFIHGLAHTTFNDKITYVFIGLILSLISMPRKQIIE